MSVRRSLIVLTFLTFALPFLFFSSRANQPPDDRAGRNWQYYTMQRGNLNVAVTALGTIEPQATARLSFTRTGRVTEVLVQPGDVVQAGDILVRQASDAQTIEYERHALAVQLAELQKQDLLEPADDAAIRIAEANVDSAWGAYLGIQNATTPEDIQAAEIRFQQALAAQEAAIEARIQADADQVDQVYQLLDAQVGEATFNAEIARLQLESLKNGNSGALNAAYARVLQAQKELERIQAGPTQAEIDQMDISIQQARAQLDQSQLALDDTLLVAPFDGLVSAINIEVGALGTPALPVIELTDMSALRLIAQVDEIDIRQIQEGMSAQVYLDALPEVSLPATIERIAFVGTNQDGITSFDVVIRLADLDPQVRIGMTAEASIIVEEKRDVLVLPNLYIRLDRESGRAFVNLVRSDGTVEEVEVQLGLQGQDSSEVVSGLAAGDMVAVDLSSDRISFLGG